MTKPWRRRGSRVQAAGFSDRWPTRPHTFPRRKPSRLSTLRRLVEASSWDSFRRTHLQELR